MTYPSPEALHKRYEYDPQTGNFLHKRAQGRIKIGDVAGYFHRDGYIELRFDNRAYKAHRVAWIMYYGVEPPPHLDHRDRNRAKNAIANLRGATIRQNGQNRKSRGFYPLKSGRFIAQIKADGRLRRLGTFDTAEEARSAYIAASLKYFGEFSIFADGANHGA